jgi:polar amino acid transport system substrate-binding protein
VGSISTPSANPRGEDEFEVLRVLRMRIRIAAGLAVVVALAGCEKPNDSLTAIPDSPAAQPLRVGMEIAFKPFEFTDEKTGKPAGFDVELVQALGAHLGRRVDLVNVAWDSLIPELTSGRVDLLCSGMSYTEERAKTVDFSRPYAGSPMCALVNVERAKGATTVDDLDKDGMEIAVQRGTTGETKARARFPKAKLLVFETQADAGNTLATGRATAFVYDKNTIDNVHEQHRDTTRILSGDLGQESYCMAVAKGSPLKAEIDEFLETETKPGAKVDELLKKWIPGWEQYRVRPR